MKDQGELGQNPCQENKQQANEKALQRKKIEKTKEIKPQR